MKTFLRLRNFLCGFLNLAFFFWTFNYVGGVVTAPQKKVIVRWPMNWDLDVKFISLEQATMNILLKSVPLVQDPWFLVLYYRKCNIRTGLSNPWPAGRMRPSTAMSVAQHKIINFLKPFIYMNVHLYNTWSIFQE